MGSIRKKLNSESGLSILIAMFFMALCIMVSALVITSVLGSARATKESKEVQQAYLTTSSVAEMMAKSVEIYPDSSNFTEILSDMMPGVPELCSDSSPIVEDYSGLGVWKNYKVKLPWQDPEDSNDYVAMEIKIDQVNKEGFPHEMFEVTANFWLGNQFSMRLVRGYIQREVIIKEIENDDGSVTYYVDGVDYHYSGYLNDRVAPLLLKGTDGRVNPFLGGGNP